MACSKISDPLDDIVKELDLELDVDIELFDEDLAEALNEDLEYNPNMSKTVTAMLQTPKQELEEANGMDEDPGNPDIIVPENIYEPIVNIKEELQKLEPLPTENLQAPNWHQPTYIDVKLFVRQDSSKRSPTTVPAGSFMIPYLPGSLRDTNTYRNMVELATTLVKRSRPYQKASSFFYVYIVRPTFAYITKSGHQFTVTEVMLTKTLNKSIPSPRITESDCIQLIMVVTADLSPKYNLHHIKSLLNQPQQHQQMAQQHQQTVQQSNGPVHSRLGPPVVREFQRLLPANTTLNRTINKENDCIHQITINESPQPSGYNPESGCLAPKTNKTNSKAKNRMANLKKGKQPLQPRQLYPN